MGKNTGKMIAINKMMKGSPNSAGAVRASEGEGAMPESSAKRSRKAETVGEGISGDILEDNFMVEDLAAGDDGDMNALDGGSDAGSDDEDRLRAADNKKRKLEALKEKKKAKAGEAPRREDSLAVAAASAETKADFFLKHFRASDTGGKMSSVETTDFVSSDHFLGTSLKIETIAEQLVELCPACFDGVTKGKHAGSSPAPFVAILVSSSQRGGQVYQLLKEASKGNAVVKAYESHSKVKKLLSKFLASDAALGTRIVIATAGRLLRLLSGGELEGKRLQYMVMDLASDTKQRTLLDMKEVREDVMKLHTQILSPLLSSAQLKIAFI